MPPPRTRRRACLALLLAAGLAVSVAALPAQAAPARQPAGSGTNYAARGHLATEWQASQLVNGRMPGFAPGYPDWGLTIDTSFMLAADGTQATVLAEVRKAISHHILDYAVYKGDTASGAMSKALLASEVLKGDPTDFGGLDLRARVLALVAPAGKGFEAGRLRDTGKTDYSNVFGQSYGTIGLSRSGAVPQDVVDYLLKQRCTGGYFRLYETAGETCDQSGSDPDVDATALALQALVAAKADGAMVSHTVIMGTASWLISVESPDGSWSEDASSSAPSSNSTGLAANALYAVGHNAPRLRAAAYLATMQITKSRAAGGPARGDIGAIAFSPTELAKALAHGLGDDRSQWWRVAPQAAFAFVPAPLGTLTAP